MTADIDLVVDLAPEEASKAIDVLLEIGFKAQAPVDPRQFADYPMDFELLFRDSLLMTLTSTPVRVASLEHLIAIKQAAGRAKDLDDAIRLIALRDRI